jgi:hypothetical protein
VHLYSGTVYRNYFAPTPLDHSNADSPEKPGQSREYQIDTLDAIGRKVGNYDGKGGNRYQLYIYIYKNIYILICI